MIFHQINQSFKHVVQNEHNSIALSFQFLRKILIIMGKGNRLDFSALKQCVIIPFYY